MVEIAAQIRQKKKHGYHSDTTSGITEHH